MFSSVAFDSDGRETKGLLDVPDQSEAVRRLKETGCFPTKIVQHRAAKAERFQPNQQNNRLCVNMVKAGEMGGVLDVVFKRLADFMEKAQNKKERQK